MSKLRQVLRFYCQGQSKLKISSVTKLSRNTVIKYINTFTALKTTWEEINRLPDKDLDELFCKEPEVSLDERLIPLHEFFKTQEKQLRQRGV